VNRFAFVARLAVSLGLVAYLAWVVDWGQAAHALGRTTKPYLLILPLCLLVGLAFASVRWRFILRRGGVDLPALRAFLAYLVGSFYGVVLPGVLAGDVVRVALCVRQTQCQVSEASASVLLERLCGFIAVGTFPLIVHYLYPQLLRFPLPAGSGLVLFAGTACMVGLLAAARFAHSSPRPRGRRALKFVHSALQVVGSQSAGAFVWIMLLSGAAQALDIVATFVVSQAMGLGLSLAAFFFVVPFVYVATALPISLGGIGVREGALVLLLGKFDVGTPDAVMLSLMIYLGRVVVGALGGITQAVGPRFRPAPPASSDHIQEGTPPPEFGTV
jgi:uncharacterized membrane protein YbhN (UPF0104 family)